MNHNYYLNINISPSLTLLVFFEGESEGLTALSGFIREGAGGVVCLFKREAYIE